MRTLDSGNRGLFTLATHGFALFADSPHRLHLLDIGEGVGDFACGFAHVHGDDADLAGAGFCFVEEGLDVAADTDHVEIHGLAGIFVLISGI